MTPEQRAEKIYSWCLKIHGLGWDDDFAERALPDIASEIRAAVQEAIRERVNGFFIHEDVLNAVRAEAYEDAARIAETELFRLGEPSHLCSGGEKIAKAIRAKAKDAIDLERTSLERQ